MKRTKQGFTLIEMAVGIIVLSIIALIVGLALSSGIQAYFQGVSSSAISNKGSVAMERMFIELKNAISLNSINSSNITFTKSDGTVVNYNLSGSTLNRSENGGSNVPLADQASGLSFAYYNASLGSTGSLSQVKAVTITLSLQETGEQPFSLINTVYLENLQ